MFRECLQKAYLEITSAPRGLMVQRLFKVFSRRHVKNIENSTSVDRANPVRLMGLGLKRFLLSSNHWRN